MANYSRFGGSSPEWQAHADAVPVPARGTRENAEELQQITNKARGELSQAAFRDLGLEQSIQWEDHTVTSEDGGSFPIRVYRPKGNKDVLPAYLFFHGGGFVFGSLDSDHASCALIALKAQMVVLHACYRHTPQYRFPVPQNDAWAAVEWTSQHMDTLGCNALIVGGISAGGNLAASVAVREAKQRARTGEAARVKGYILGCPWLVHPDAFPNHLIESAEVSSPVENADAPILPKYRVDFFTELMEVPDPKDELFSAGLATDGLAGIPKMATIVAGSDPFRDEALLFAERLTQSGVTTKTHVFPGLPHGFRLFTQLPSSRRWDDLTLEIIAWILADADKSGNQSEGQFIVEDTTNV